MCQFRNTNNYVNIKKESARQNCRLELKTPNQPAEDSILKVLRSIAVLQALSLFGIPARPAGGCNPEAKGQRLAIFIYSKIVLRLYWLLPVDFKSTSSGIPCTNCTRCTSRTSVLSVFIRRDCLPVRSGGRRLACLIRVRTKDSFASLADSVFLCSFGGS